MRFTIISIFLLTLGIYQVQPVIAQRKDPVRVELNANLDMETYKLVPCNENGILVFFESDKKGSEEGTRKWHFALYDNTLTQQWLADTAIIEGAKFQGYDSDDRYTYLFFLDNDRIRSSFNMQILKVDYTVNEFTVLNVLLPEKSQPVHFEIIENKAIIALNNALFEPRIVIIDLASGATKFIKPEVEGLNIIQEVQFDAKRKVFHFVLDNYLGKKQNALMILEISLDGSIKRSATINTVIDNKVLNQARIAFIHSDTLLVLGTYHNVASKMKDNNEENGPESAGYFIAKFANDKQLLINYFNFLEFEEMFRSLSSKTIADLRQKAEKKKNKGEEYSLDYTLLVHDIIESNGNYILLSEAYYPEYRTVTNMYYDYYGRPIPQTYTVFDGYKYISGIVASFSPEGEMNWDNGIEIRNIVTFNLSKYVGSFSNNNEMALFYSNENKINYKMIGDDYTGGASQSIRLEGKYKGDKVMEDLGSKMIHWYGNYFICYGYQKIKNNKVAGGKRTIFYFNKLAFN
jgi:hypothetical protein